MKDGKHLSLPEKISRLGVRLRDPEWRRFGGTLFLGKILGLVAIFALMIGVPAVDGMVADLVRFSAVDAATGLRVFDIARLAQTAVEDVR